MFGRPARGLALARANLAARPFGESRLFLASALLMNGQTGEALKQIALAENSGWRSAPLYALRAQALDAGIIDRETFDAGIRDLYRTAEPGGVFCYTFFKGWALKP